MTIAKTRLPATDKVVDRWWPWRVGVIIKRGKSSCAVQWMDGEIWRYDRSHIQFLRAV